MHAYLIHTGFGPWGAIAVPKNIHLLHIQGTLAWQWQSDTLGLRNHRLYCLKGQVPHHAYL